MGPKLLSSILRFALCLVAGCSTEVAQTAALLGPSDPPSCADPGEVHLPTDGPFGDGTEPPSPMVTTGYGAGVGPGLYVVARDAFRVILNDELVVESETAGEGVFVPLTLLPGDNVLSVVVSAASGTPAALVDLHELDQEIPSDVSWKVSTNPESGFASPGFDDLSWPDASDFGARGTLLGCEANDVFFPENSGAHWIGPEPGTGRTAVLRKVIRIAPVGFGAATTGGAGASATLVDTWDDLVAAAGDTEGPAVILLGEGIHDFRDPRDQLACPSVCSDDPTKTIFDVIGSDETCSVELEMRTRHDRRLDVASNKTIVGLGRGALLRGVSVALGGVENVIVRNVTLYDVNPELREAGDGFTLSAAQRVWIDHVTMKWISDGFSDLLPGSGDVSFSWVNFDGVTPGACRGFHQQAANVGDSVATFHHCFFDHVESHAPRVEGANARVHIVDSYFVDNGSYAVASICGSEVLMEKNTFERVRTPTMRETCDDESALGKIDAPDGSNEYGEDVGEHQGGDGMEPRDAVFDPPYVYAFDPSPDVSERVRDRAGSGGLWGLRITLD